MLLCCRSGSRSLFPGAHHVLGEVLCCFAALLLCCRSLFPGAHHVQVPQAASCRLLLVPHTHVATRFCLLQDNRRAEPQ